MEHVTIIDLIKQMAYVIPAILLGTQTITAAIHGAFKIKDDNINHAISWVVAVLAGLGFVAFNGLTFGLGGWDYLFGGLCGLVVGGTANGWFDWPSIKAIFDAITNLFGGNTYIERMLKEEQQLKTRIDKAETFLVSEKARTLRSKSPEKFHLLERQVAEMKSYYRTLSERIAVEKEE